MKNIRILIVDDDYDFAESMAELIEIDGHETVLANTGRQAIDIYKHNDIDLIFIDIRMPEVNGVDTFKQLRKLDPDIRVAMMTGYTDQHLLTEAEDIGAIGILRKPIDIKKLISVIQKVDGYKKIMLVDDDPDFAESLKSTLQDQGHSVTISQDSQEILDYAHGDRIEILLLDIHLKGKNGLEILQKIKQIGLNIPTIIITAYAEDYAQQLEAIRSSQDNIEVIEKPFDIDSLMQKVAAISS